MATYAFSDVHGHRATLDRLLSRVSPSDDDTIFMLGDMVDRGPDAAGVLSVVRTLPGCTTLMGNHEQLMLIALDHPGDQLAHFDWTSNGGGMTEDSLAKLDRDAYDWFVDWIRSLPLYATCEAGGRRFLLAHAGIRPNVAPVPERWDDDASREFLSAQRADDLLWIRDGFWDVPTGLVDGAGMGPIVVAGHTPTLYVERSFGAPPAVGEDGLCHMVFCGAGEATGGVPDKIAIDCAAAAGAGIGQVGMICLDTLEATYEAVRDGE